eukprot:4248200-Heterocapsa_arctica.AAC.1
MAGCSDSDLRRAFAIWLKNYSLRTGRLLLLPGLPVCRRYRGPLQLLSTAGLSVGVSSLLFPIKCSYGLTGKSFAVSGAWYLE